MSSTKKNLFTEKGILGRAIKASFLKLNPKALLKKPVLFLVCAASVFMTGLYFAALCGALGAGVKPGFLLCAAVSMWLTVLLANFAEALAQGHGNAQADTLRAVKKEVTANRIPSVEKRDKITEVPSVSLRRGDLVLVRAGEQIPADGEVAAGAASVDESAITGESAPVLRESGSSRGTVTGGTTVISDWLIIEVTSEAGESFLDKMIAMVENPSRKPIKKETALQILPAAIAAVLLLVTVLFLSHSAFATEKTGFTVFITLTALLVCLLPTTVSALFSPVNVAGISRLNRANVLAQNEKALEAAGKANILLLDKTGAITLGNRQACEFLAVDDVDIIELADAAQLASLADETPEGRSVVVLAKEQFGIRGRGIHEIHASFFPFSAKTQMSGVDFSENEIRKGTAEAIREYVLEKGGRYSNSCDAAVRQVSNQGGTPLLVAKNGQILGVIHLKDIIKRGVKEKFTALRRIGIKTIMITGDNPLTAAAIAAEAGVDDFLAEATPESKLKLIREFQAKGHTVAMTGNGVSDAPALAQADAAVAMNTGAQSAKEAGNMVDLDSSPTKLLDIVRIGRQLLATRASLITFGAANGLVKYFMLIPVLFPALAAFNILNLHSAESAVLSILIYNVLILAALLPLALSGVKYHEAPAVNLLLHRLLVYGGGGLILPFAAIKAIDMLLAAFGLL